MGLDILHIRKPAAVGFVVEYLKYIEIDSKSHKRFSILESRHDYII